MLPLHEDTTLALIKKSSAEIFAGLAGKKFVSTNDWTTVFSDDLKIDVNFIGVETADSLHVSIMGGATKSMWPNGNIVSASWTPWSQLANFTLKYLDGGYTLVFGGANLHSCLRNRGFGVKLHKMRLEVAKLISSHSVVATSSKNNSVQNKIFNFFGWQKGDLDAEHYIWWRKIQPTDNYEIKQQKK